MSGKRHTAGQSVHIYWQAYRAKLRGKLQAICIRPDQMPNAGDHVSKMVDMQHFAANFARRQLEEWLVHLNQFRNCRAKL